MTSVVKSHIGSKLLLTTCVSKSFASGLPLISHTQKGSDLPPPRLKSAARRPLAPMTVTCSRQPWFEAGGASGTSGSKTSTFTLRLALWPWPQARSFSVPKKPPSRSKSRERRMTFPSKSASPTTSWSMTVNMRSSPGEYSSSSMSSSHVGFSDLVMWRVSKTMCFLPITCTMQYGSELPLPTRLKSAGRRPVAPCTVTRRRLPSTQTEGASGRRGSRTSTLTESVGAKPTPHSFSLSSPWKPPDLSNWLASSLTMPRRSAAEPLSWSRTLNSKLSPVA
mmetsp:Transcript_72096/g.185986  ORF Transcript_72096/g.185986 Transcript_72096/m.185986 type:complete len:279 (+) Transcript_72096:69-905(+)